MKFALTLILGLFFAAAGVGLLAGAYLLHRHRRGPGAGGATAPGVVVRLEERRGPRGGRGYAPVVRFSTEHGQEIEFAAALSTNPAAYGAGDKVSVTYDPERPGSADVDSFASRWFGPLALLALGVVFAALGGYALLHARSAPRATRRS